MRATLVLACVLIAVGFTTAALARGQVATMTAPARLTPSYAPPAGDRLGDRIRARAWTYDSALVTIARTLRGDVDGAASLLDVYLEVQREDGAIDASYDLAGRDGAGPLRAGNQAWIGLAALQWRARTCSDRYDRLITRVAQWLLAHRISDRESPGFGLVRGGPDVPWTSTEHNLEARAFFAALDAVLTGRPLDGRRCRPAMDAVARDGVRDAVVALDRAIGSALYSRDGFFRQGLGDDARALDAQALGILWLLRHDRVADAKRVERATDRTMWLSGRRVAWPGAKRQTFSGYRPFAEDWLPDVLWMEGTLMMRLAKARLGRDMAALDGEVARWVALSAPGLPLQVDRAAGEDYHVWPAAAPGAWLVMSREFTLL